MKDLNNIQTIVKGCRKADPKYQRLLVDKFADRLYAICIRYMNDKEEAKDMLQESFTKIFNNIASYDFEKAGLYTWMSTITVRVCLKKLQRRTLDVIHLDDAFEVPAFNSKPLDALELNDLIALINLLPDSLKDVFNMHVIDGFAHKEIAEILGISVVLSRTRLKRSKELLRKYIYNIETKRSWKSII